MKGYPGNKYKPEIRSARLRVQGSHVSCLRSRLIIHNPNLYVYPFCYKNYMEEHVFIQWRSIYIQILNVHELVTHFAACHGMPCRLPLRPGTNSTSANKPRPMKEPVSRCQMHSLRKDPSSYLVRTVRTVLHTMVLPLTLVS